MLEVMTTAAPESSRAPSPETNRTERLVTAAVVTASALFVFWQLQPGLIFSDTTPTGGDMGAHVWGPAFLRDELLPRLQLTGWTPDWYTGFPAFHFYMVVPALAIVILDVGLNPFIAIPIVIGLLAFGILRRIDGNTKASRRWIIAAAVLAPLIIPLPYNIAFKLIAVSGVVMFPVAAWALGHFSGLRYPGPAVLSLASLAFAFDRSFNIYGGNIASTLAGEFAASISLSISLVALGLVIRGTRTGEYKRWAGVAIALTGLSHLLPAFFLLAAVMFVMIVRVVQRRFGSISWIMIAGTLSAFLSAFWVLPFFLRTDYLNDMGWERIEILHSPLVTRSNLNPANILTDFPPFPVLLVLAAIGFALSIVRKVELGWVLALTAGLMAAGFVWFPDGRLWNARILPFYYLCVGLLAGLAIYLMIVQMTRIPAAIRLGVAAASAIMLIPSQIRGAVVWPEPATSFSEPIDSFGRLFEVLGEYIPAALAYSSRVVFIATLAVFVATELPRALGHFFSRLEVAIVSAAIAVIAVTPARDVSVDGLSSSSGVFWAVVLVGAIAALVSIALAAYPRVAARLAEARGTGGEDGAGDAGAGQIYASFRAPLAIVRNASLSGAPILVAGGMFVLLGLSLRSIGGVETVETVRVVDGVETTQNIPTWSLGPLEIGSVDESFIPGWASWNFSGLQGKPEVTNGLGDVGQGGWEEYEFVQRTMLGVGDEVGCGRAMWEFAPELNRYGTTMAMMLMPLWSDGCIGSMEGLYFEATPTVPYHFMLQSDLSAPSRQVGNNESVGGPSRAMRDLPYGEFDIDRGVARMLDMGVRYYMAFSPSSVEAARNHEALTEVGNATPWVVFEAQEAELVSPLDTMPVVVDGVRDHQDQWLDLGMEWFEQPDQARPASSGPADWEHISAELVVERYEGEETRLAGSIEDGAPTLDELLPDVGVTTETTVMNVETDTDRISFSVDQIGTPVLVRTSYFPAWKANGAEGPFRVAPNFMVVVPTEENVELVYSRTATDWLAIAMTFMGFGALGLLGRRRNGEPEVVELAPDATFGVPVIDATGSSDDSRPLEELGPVVPEGEEVLV